MNKSNTTGVILLLLLYLKTELANIPCQSIVGTPHPP